MGYGDMKLISNTKKLLNSYNSIVASCENIKDEIDNMEYTGLKISKIDGMPYNVTTSSGTEIEALIMIAKKEKLTTILNKNKTTIRIINRALGALPEKEKNIIIGYYIKNNTWDEIGIIVSHTPRHCLRLRDSALEKITIAIYGQLKGDG